MNARKLMLGTLLVSLALVTAASAGEPVKEAAKPPKWKGSIVVSPGQTEAEIVKMAKISLADAEKIALRNVTEKAEDKEILESELEVEDGYLVYSVEIKIAGQDGVEELVIDAGTGQVLAREHEEEDGEEDEGQIGGTDHGVGDDGEDDDGEDHTGEPKGLE